MRRKILAFTAVFVLAPAVLFAGAAPVAAHHDPTSGFSHTSCAGGIVAFVEAGGLGLVGPGPSDIGPSGADISTGATAEPGALAAAVNLAHLLICDAS